VHGFVNGPDFGKISIAYPGFRPPYWISGDLFTTEAVEACHCLVKIFYFIFAIKLELLYK